MKGLSPLIATIVLIGITITVGATISVFISNIITRNQDPQTVCGSNANYMIESAEFNKTGDSRLVVHITNKNKESLYGFSVEIQNGTDVESFSDTVVTLSPAITASDPLGQEESALVKVDLTGYADLASTMNYVKVRNKACPSVSAESRSISKY
ncbi:MAG: hypothetical protein HY518_02015 [Candidatus Aenigmarchaeota archaeon]|nr:hypothetical protein [Candidatus Aenigmarchaeota archaeon]